MKITCGEPGHMGVFLMNERPNSSTGPRNEDKGYWETYPLSNVDVQAKVCTKVCTIWEVGIEAKEG